jgi:Fic family protein
VRWQTKRSPSSPRHVPTSDRLLPGGFLAGRTEDPLLCSVADKPRLEVANTVAQLAYIEELVDNGVVQLREGHVHTFHKLAVDGIFPCGGAYRTWTLSAELRGSKHIPPEPARVPGLVLDALDRINTDLARARAMERAHGFASALQIAAYALWRFNWIHPFAGGNGRTSRSLAYLVLCIDFGTVIPGAPTWPTRIARRVHGYERALRVADAAELRGTEDLSAMTRLVTETAMAQVRSIIKDLTRRIRARRARRRSAGRSDKKRAAKMRRGRR